MTASEPHLGPEHPIQPISLCGSSQRVEELLKLLGTSVTGVGFPRRANKSPSVVPPVGADNHLLQNFLSQKVMEWLVQSLYDFRLL